VAVRSDSGEVLIRRMLNGELLQSLNVSGNVDRLAFSRDGSLLAMATDKGAVSLWQAGDGTLLFTFDGHVNRGANLAFSPDGKLLAYASGYAVKLWDTASGQELHMMQGSADLLNAVAIASDGRRLAARPWNGNIGLWQLPEGTQVSLLPTDSKVISLAFSTDSSLLASGAQDGSIKLWDSSTGQLLATLVGHMNWVAGVAFSPDGMRLLSTSADGTLRVWGIPSANP
jgi:WD40 repeat protein